MRSMQAPLAIIATLISTLLFSHTLFAETEAEASTMETAPTSTSEQAQAEATEAVSEAVEEAAEETVSNEAEAAAAEAPMATPEDLTSIRYSCANQQLTRRLEVDYLDAPQQVPCEVNYYKDTEMPDTKQTLWQAQNTAGYCEDMAQGFVAKLSNWGWDCEKL